MTMQGIWIGNGSGTTSSIDQMVQSYESWLGKAVDGVAVHTGFQNWADWSGSIGWIAGINANANADHKIFWSIPLIPRSEATMGAAGTGAYNAQYVAAAQKLLESEAGSEPIYVRTGWEFNAYWSPVSASAVGQPQNYINAYRNFVDSFRTVSNRFVFEWTPNIGSDGALRAEDGYPGDAYVDVIGMDFYWDSKQSWSTQDPLQAWNWNLTQPNGLNWLADFAAQHGKQIAISEWGVNSNNAAPYIEKALQWFADHNVLYQTYWESDAAFSGMLSSGQYPATAEAFLKAFGYLEPEPPAVPELPQIPDLPAITEPSASAKSQAWIGGTYLMETLTGSVKHDAIQGGGWDTLKGGKGDDSYSLNEGDIVVELENEGIDTVTTWMKTYTLTANVENLFLASTSAQTGTGNMLANRISGGKGDNIIRGMGGNDWIITGDGKDVVVFKKGDGHDVLTDFSANDRLQLLGFALTSAEIASKLYEKNGNVVLYLDADNTITFLGKTIADLNLLNISQDIMDGTSGNDSYLVLNGSDIINEGVGQGIDAVYSHAASYTMAANVEHAVLMVARYLTQSVTGNDLDNIITGGEAHDTINGKAGNDTLRGGIGNDTLTGGMGLDAFVFNAGDGEDTITDFNAGLGVGDTLKLEGYNFANFDALRAVMTQSGSHVILNLGSGNKLTLQYHKISDFVADDFGFHEIVIPTFVTPAQSGAVLTSFTGTTLAETLRGDDLNNSLDGRGSTNGLDSLVGGKGDDVYLVYTGKEFVTEKTGEGIDTVESVAASTTLGTNLENLRLIGGGAQTGIGNTLNNYMVGGDGDTVLKGGSGDDALYGGLGNDVLYGETGFDLLYGGAGADQFVFQAANAFTGLDQLMDFSTVEGDKIVLGDLLVGYDAITSAINDFVNVTSYGGTSVISVDRDGLGSKYDFKAIALTNGTELADADTLLSSGNLVP